MNQEKMFLGKRKIYNGGNSKNITVPMLVMKELEKEKGVGAEIKEVELFYDRVNRELILKF